jgi:inosine-uridine nucleoside N-ribohydrolase
MDAVYTHDPVVNPFSPRLLALSLPMRRGVYGMDAVYTHDAAALAAVIEPSLFTWVEGAVVVVADGVAKGRTILDEGQ